MTKTEFQDLLHRYTQSTRTEADDVLLLEKKYPYSQLLHSLAARVSKDHALDNQQSVLQLAAVYSADRHVLKEIMAGTLATVSDNQPTDNRIIVRSETPVVKVSSPVEESAITSSVIRTIDSIDYAEEVIHDLERLHELRINFENAFASTMSERPAKVHHHESPISHKPKVTHSITSEKKKSSSPAHKKSSTKAHTTKAKASAKKQGASKEKKGKKVAGKDQKKTKPAAKKVAKPKARNSSEDLIAQIEASKKKLIPEGKKQQEQIELIDQFIKAQPSIASIRERNAQNGPPVDLADLKQGEFGEQIISETLANILIKQGKNDKAIEVLRKLIWKFPQKKAYFVAQIEELKK